MFRNAQLDAVLPIIERLQGDVEHLKQALEDACRPASDVAPPPAPLQDVERDHIVDVLRKTGGNRMAAARALGISRRSLYRRLERHHIEYGARPRAGAASDE